MDHYIPSTSSTESSTQIHIAYCPPADEAMWVDIKYPSSAGKVIMNNSNIVAYFVSRSVYDGLPAGDFKAINKSAQYLFGCGHVQHIEYCCTSDVTYVRTNCIPEMRKDRFYKIVVELDNSTFDIAFAVCGCPAGKGPRPASIYCCTLLWLSRILYSSAGYS